METNLLFAYGTLKDPKVQIELTGREWIGYPSKIDGFEQISITLDSGTYPALVFGNSSIYGMIYQINPEELSIIDEYEGSSYKRILSITSEPISLVYLYIYEK
jgi:gamma-glutamylcyclotransferase (GGCT)/AIG2-like uncharacterized protein YtfP